VPDEMPIIEIIAKVAKSEFLAKIAGGQATWFAMSNIPIAVIAQQMLQPKPMPFFLFILTVK